MSNISVKVKVKVDSRVDEMEIAGLTISDVKEVTPIVHAFVNNEEVKTQSPVHIMSDAIKSNEDKIVLPSILEKKEPIVLEKPKTKSKPIVLDPKGKFISNEPKKKEYVYSTEKKAIATNTESMTRPKLGYVECEGCKDNIIKKIEPGETEVTCRKCNHTTSLVGKTPRKASMYCGCGNRMYIPLVYTTSDQVDAKCPKCKEEIKGFYEESDGEFIGY